MRYDSDWLSRMVIRFHSDYRSETAIAIHSVNPNPTVTHWH